MDPISQVKVSNTSYEIKDATSRAAIVTLNLTKQNALQYYTENNGSAYTNVYSNSGHIELACLDDETAWPRGAVNVNDGGIELNYKDGYINGTDEIENAVTLSHDGFKFNNKQIATTDQIPSKTSDLTNDSGFLTQAPVISVNGQTGAVSLTIPSSPGTLNTTATTAQTTSSSEALSGNITLHKVAKTGTYSDLIGTPTIPTVPANVSAFTNDSGYITSANVVTIYSGSTAPSSSLGNNGDIYIQTS